MISIVILLILAWSFYIGYSRGIVLQAYYTLSAIVSAIIASNMYQSLGKQLSLLVPYASATEGAMTYFFSAKQLFQLDQVFYAGLAFLIIYTIAYSLARLLGILMHLVPVGDLDQRNYNMASGVLSVFVTVFGLQMVFFILATIPMAPIQEHLNASAIVRFLITSTPFTSGFLKQLWVTSIIG